MIAPLGRLLPLVLLAAWEALGRLGLLDPRFVPAPSAVFASVGTPEAARDLLGHMGLTLGRTLGGFLLGGALGAGLGLACGTLRRLDRALAPLVDVLRPVPSVAVIPVAVLFLGLGGVMNMAVAAFACAWPVFVATRDGVRAVPPPMLDAARACGLSPGRTLGLVVVPACLPGAAAGLQAALGIAAAVAVGSEMVASSDGLGHLAMSAMFARQQPLAWAAVLAMGLVGGFCALGFACLRRLAMRRNPGLFGPPQREGGAP